MFDPDAINSQLPEGWQLASRSDPFLGLECPHGHRIELDGSCPDGCESPLKGRGLV